MKTSYIAKYGFLLRYPPIETEERQQQRGHKAEWSTAKLPEKTEAAQQHSAQPLCRVLHGWENLGWKSALALRRPVARRPAGRHGGWGSRPSRVRHHDRTAIQAARAPRPARKRRVAAATCQVTRLPPPPSPLHAIGQPQVAALLVASRKRKEESERSLGRRGTPETQDAMRASKGPVWSCDLDSNPETVAAPDHDSSHCSTQYDLICLCL